MAPSATWTLMEVSLVSRLLRAPSGYQSALFTDSWITDWRYEQG